VTRGRAQPTVLLAGWLFADLAVGLVIILLATATDAPRPVPEAAASPTPPAASPTPTPSPTPVTVAAVDTEPVLVRVQSDAGALLAGDSGEVERVADEIREQVAPLQEQGRTAAFTLTFGASPSPGEGVALARAANEILRDVAPDLAGNAVLRDFWRAAGGDGTTRGTLVFEIYLFVVR